VMAMKQVAIVTLKLSVSVFLLFLLYRATPIRQVGELLANINLLYLPVIGLLLIINTIISAWKWQLFLRADGISLSIARLTVSYMSGTFCNLFLPSSIGGDTYRVYDIARKSKQGVRSAASVFADRFSGFIALVSLSLVSSLFVAKQFGSMQIVIVPLLLFVGFVILLVLLLQQRVLRLVLGVTRLNRIGFVEKVSEKLFQSFTCYGSDRKLMAQVILLSFTFQFSVITVVYLLARALGISVAYFYFSAFVPLITLMEALPISIYGIGVRDYGYVFFFTQTGMSAIETRTLALLFMAVAVCYSLLGGLFFLYKIWQKPGA